MWPETGLSIEGRRVAGTVNFQGHPSRLNNQRSLKMRTSHLLICASAATLMSGSAITSQHSEPGVFYDPSNAASPTGKTTGYELFRTIGCPGRALLDKPCPVPPEKAPEPEPVVESPPAAVAPEPAALAPAAAPAPTPAPAPLRLVLDDVNFDFDKASLRPQAYPKLDEAAESLKGWGDGKVEVAGHTDSRGSDAYNMDLSLRRAESVKNYLVTKGIPADRLVIKGYGESQPVADNATDEGRFQNRRVELNPMK
jgi:outer membrane protein OmpA-like peptidoglycan-associated protein